MRKNIDLLLVICMAILITMVNTQNGSAQYFGSVNINADGTIEPATAPIQRIGETYLLTGNVGSITVERSNIVIDGNGNMLPGIVSSYDDTLKKNITAHTSKGIFLNKVDNVTVKNLIIKDCETGIYLERSTNCVIANNTITGANALIPQIQITSGIFVWGGNYNTITENKLADNYNGLYICYDSQNTIVGNTIINSTSTAILIWNASHNILYCNNFIDNAVQASVNEPSVNIWDNAKNGNYWSDYNGTDLNFDGVGDTPYAVDEDNLDHYPLIVPFDGSDASPSPSMLTQAPEPQPFLTVALVAVSTASVVAVGAGLIVYFKKHPQTVNKSTAKSEDIN
jgi:parallel beta-helix repeat protein